MNRRVLARVLVVACAAAVVPVSTPFGAAAQTSDDIQAEVERMTDELERLEEQSDILAEDYVTAIDEKNQLDAEVATAEQRVAEKEAEVTALRGELADVAVRAFTNSGSDDFGPLFSDSTDFTQALQRDQLSRVALSTGTATTDELDQAVADLNAERDDLESKREAASDKAAQVESAKEATDARRSEYLEARADAEARLGEALKAEEEARAKASYEKMLAEQAAAKAAADAAAAAAAEEAARQAVRPAAPPPADDGGDDDGGSDSGGSGTTAPPADDGDDGGGNDDDGDGTTPLQNPNPAPAPEPAAPPVSSRAQVAVQAAMSQLGVPYVYATSKPGVSFDCSGLTMYAWGVAGVGLPHQSRAQFAPIPHVPASQAQPGDLLFFYPPISHVSIYLGGGQHVHAPNSGTTVKTGTVNWSNVVGVGRPG